MEIITLTSAAHQGVMRINAGTEKGNGLFKIASVKLNIALRNTLHHMPPYCKVP